MISGRGKNGLSTEVTTENHEHVLVLADELLPHLLAVVAFEFPPTGGSRLVFLQVGVRQDNGTMVWMLGNDSVRPIQDFVAGEVLKSDDKKLQPCFLEVIPGIVMAIRIEGAAKLLPFCKFLAWKVLIEQRGSIDGDIESILVIRFLIPHVMVAEAHAVAHFPIQYRHGFLGDGPFLGDVPLHDISFVDEKSDIESLLIVADPFRLRKKVTP